MRRAKARRSAPPPRAFGFAPPRFRAGRFLPADRFALRLAFFFRFVAMSAPRRPVCVIRRAGSRASRARDGGDGAALPVRPLVQPPLRKRTAVLGLIVLA